jgi:hypothetical protein
LADAKNDARAAASASLLGTEAGFAAAPALVFFTTFLAPPPPLGGGAKAKNAETAALFNTTVLEGLDVMGTLNPKATFCTSLFPRAFSNERRRHRK